MAQGDWPREGEQQEERRARVWRILGVLAALLAFGLLVSIIHVSTYRVRHGTQVFSQPEWVVGQRAALRVVVLDLGSSTYRWGVKVEAFLEPASGTAGDTGRERRALGEGTIGSSRSLELNPALPSEMQPGPYRLVLEITVPEEAPETIRMPVKVVARPPELAGAGLPEEPWLILRHVCEEGRYRKVQGGWSNSARCKKLPRTRLYPESGTLVGNLENRVFLWTEPTEDGPAFAWRLRVPPLAPGLKAPETTHAFEMIEVDALGLGEFILRPGFPRQSLEVKEGEGVRSVWLRDAPSQILVQAERGMQRSDETFVAQIVSMRRDVTLYLDLWLEGRWIGADSVTLAGSDSLRYEVALPDEAAGLALLQVSTSPDGSGGTGDTRAIFIDSRAETAQGLRRLIERLEAIEAAESQGGSVADEEIPREPAAAELLALEPIHFARVTREGLDRAASLLLSRLELGGRPTPLLGDDTAPKQEKLARWKRSLRRPLIAGLVTLISSVFFLGILSVVRSRREMKAKLAALELDEEAFDEDGTSLGTITSSGMGLSAAVLVTVLVVAVIGMVVLLETLRWDLGS